MNVTLACSSVASSWTQALLSGFGGAIFAVLVSGCLTYWRKLKEYKSLLQGVIAECDYNLSILDEIAQGICSGRGSFKRVKTDFFAEMRKASYQYRPSTDFYEDMARVSCDEELFNRELDELKTIDPLSARWQVTAKTALHAKVGVYGSLIKLKEDVEKELSTLTYWRTII